MFGYKLIKAADYNTMNLLQKKNKAQHELICKQHCEIKQLESRIAELEQVIANYETDDLIGM